MKKKVLVLLVVAILAITPAMAANSKGASEDGSVGIGLNLGTNTGLGLKFGMGKFDIFANVGLSFLNGYGLGADVGVSYEVYDIDLGGKHHMPVTVGLMAPVEMNWNPFYLSVSALIHAGLEYQIPDVPVLFYLRLGLGAKFNISKADDAKFVDFTGSGALGVLYVF